MTLIIIAFTSVSLGLFLSFLCLLHFPRDASTRFLAAFIAFVSLWALTPVVASVKLYPYMERYIFVFAILMAYFLYLFSASITNQWSKRAIERVTIVTGFFVMLAGLTEHVVRGVNVVVGSDGALNAYLLDRAQAYPLVIIWISFLGLLSAITFRKYARVNTSFRLLEIAVYLGSVSAAITNVALPLMTGSTTPTLYAFIAQVLWSVGFTAFMFSHLRHSREDEVLKNKSKDDFISLASHQLRTPISIISLNNKMVIDGTFGNLSEEQKSAISESQLNVERMSSIVEELLEAARINEGTFKVAKKSTNISKLVRSIAENHTKVAKEKGITLRLNDRCGQKKIMIDGVKIEEVISNLIDNSIKYSPKNSTVLIEATIENGRFELKITDQGIGVSKKDQKLMFTKFGRADNAKKKRPDGLGLGLFLAAKTIEAHDGEMIFESKLGKGSVFGFRVPVN